MSRLLDEELAPYRRGEMEKIVTNGPAVFLEPATAQILALTLHELATNAAKYGALSSTVGRVRLSWQVGPGHLELQWVETGGRPVSKQENICGYMNMVDIGLINPRFETSYWGLEHALHLFAKFGKRANMPVSALPLLAALTPAEHKITVIDENVENIDFALCAKADIVGITGMTVQRFRITEILKELKGRAASRSSTVRGSASRRIISARWPMSYSWGSRRDLAAISCRLGRTETC